MDEFSLIKRYFTDPFDNSLDISGGGDDCAIIALPEGFRQVVSIDTMVEGRHFPVDMPPADIGYRALAVALSDLAAMGATPWWFTLALTLPETSASWLQAFSEGLQGLAKGLNIQLLGGDTTRGPLTITVQVTGLLPNEQGLYRSGAKSGDIVAVTGTLGDAAAGLAQWQQAGADSFLRQRYCRPTPRIDTGNKLLAVASSCIDISDGLLADAGHIAQRSGVALHLNVDQLPLSNALANAVDTATAKRYAASGGDDYELCFTIAPQNLPKLQALAIDYSCIGYVSEGAGVSLVDAAGAAINFSSTGYQHFND